MLYNIIATRYFAYLEITGLGIFPVSGFNVTYKLNKVPIAEVYLPFNRSLSTANLAEAITQLLGTTIQPIPAKLYLKIVPISTYGAAFNPYLNGVFATPVGTPFPVFIGYLRGAQTERSFGRFAEQKTNPGGIVIKVFLEHYLSDLDFTHILSTATHPSMPSDMFFNWLPAMLPGAVPADRPLVSVLLFFLAEYGDMLAKLDMQGLRGLLGFLNYIMSYNFFTYPGPGIGQLPAPVPVNDPRRLSLFTFEPLKNMGYIYGVPLIYRGTLIPAFGNDGALPISTQTLTQEMERLLSAITTAPNLTAWQFLLMFCENFGTMIVPLVSRALIVPNTPTKIGIYKLIHPTEILSLKTIFYNPRPVSCAIVRTTPSAMLSALPGGSNDDSRTVYVWGAVRLPMPGTIIMLRAPSFLGPAAFSVQNIPPFLQWSPDPNAIWSEANPGTNPMLPGMAAQTTPFFIGNSMLLDYALQYLTESLFVGRTAYVTLPLRTDIGPGSIVRIGSYAGTGIIGRVQSVTLSANTDAGAANTILELDYVRSDKESFLGVTNNFMWAVPWLGAPLYAPGM